MPFDAYVKRGLLKRQRANFTQIEQQLRRAQRDLRTARLIVEQDPSWAATMAYQAMLRAGRALLFSKGYLPADGAQHRTVVELTHQLLGHAYAVLVGKFEQMRRKRHLFFYEAELVGTLTEAVSALKAASQLLLVIQDAIRKAHPQLHLHFEK